jgi:hypothetical protein
MKWPTLLWMTPAILARGIDYNISVQELCLEMIREKGGNSGGL